MKHFFDMTDDELVELSDEYIISKTYFIKYFSFCDDFTQRKADVMRYLTSRLLKLAEKGERIEKSKAESQLVTCGCGCVCEKGLVMSASFGSSCPDCYDVMSN